MWSKSCSADRLQPTYDSDHDKEFKWIALIYFFSTCFQFWNHYLYSLTEQKWPGSSNNCRQFFLDTWASNRNQNVRLTGSKKPPSNVYSWEVMWAAWNCRHTHKWVTFQEEFSIFDTNRPTVACVYSTELQRWERSVYMEGSSSQHLSALTFTYIITWKLKHGDRMNSN